MTLTKKELHLIRVAEHLHNLKVLGYKPKDLKPIQKLEKKMHKFNEDDCNGLINDEDESRRFREAIEGEVRKLFNCHLKYLYINGDPRGYALKIDDENDDTNRLYRDMDGYGILSPDFE